MIDVVLLAKGEWINVIVPIAFLVYAIIQLIASKAGAQPVQPQRRPNEPAERPLGAPQPAKPAPGPQGQLNSEIEQFLKRAGERRDRSRREGVAPPAKSPPRPPVQPRAEAQSQGNVSSPPHREMDTVTASVEKHLANRGFADRAQHLADDVVRSEAQLEEHLKQAFTRKIGTLGQTTPTVPSAPVTDVAPTSDETASAASIAALLTNPQHVKQALVLNEILTRPEHRW